MLGLTCLLFGLWGCGETSSSSSSSTWFSSSEPSSSSSSTAASSSEDSTEESNIHAVEMSVIDLTQCAVSEEDPRYQLEPKTVESYHRYKKVKLYYLGDIDDIYYISLESFATLFRSDLDNNLSSSVSEENGVATWRLSNKGNLVYRISLDAMAKTMSVDGLTINTYITNSIDTGETGVEGQSNIEPETLRVFNKNLFYFIMDNYYGISIEKGIKSMGEYFEAFEDSEDFLNENGTKRGNAYFRLVQMLNDLHTAYSYSPYFGEYGDSEAIYSQTLYRIRMDLATLLTDMRQSSIDEYNKANSTNVTQNGLRYSSDGRYAYFSFDNFNSYHVFDEGYIPKDVWEQDPFNLFVNNLQECKRRGVERVIIDDSCNSGGYITTMAKLLALLSKDNCAEMYVQGGDNGSIEKITARVDSNKDDIYDERDCFGNDFEFYIVTSNFSYSCGNAFPFIAAANGYAKIVGQKSGGGECCVYHFNFPSGQTLQYSSPFHLGFYGSDGEFRGAETGTFTQISIGNGFHDLYDVDAVASRIEETDGQMPFFG